MGGGCSSPKSMSDTSLLGVEPEPGVRPPPCLEAETQAAGFSFSPLTEALFFSESLFSAATFRSSSSCTGS